MDGLDRNDHSIIQEALLDRWGLGDSSAGEPPREVGAAREANSTQQQRVGLIGPTKGRFGAVTLACHQLIENCGFSVKELDAEVFSYDCGELGREFETIVVLPLSSGALGKYMQIYLDVYGADATFAKLQGGPHVVSFVPAFQHGSNFVRDHFLQQYTVGHVRTLKTIPVDEISGDTREGAATKKFFEKYFGTLAVQLAPVLYARCMGKTIRRPDRSTLKESVAAGDSDAKREADMSHNDESKPAVQMNNYGSGNQSYQDVKDNEGPTAVASTDAVVSTDLSQYTADLAEAFESALNADFDRLATVLKNDTVITEDEMRSVVEQTEKLIRSHNLDDEAKHRIREFVKSAGAALAASTAGSAVATAILNSL